MNIKEILATADFSITGEEAIKRLKEIYARYEGSDSWTPYDLVALQMGIKALDTITWKKGTPTENGQYLIKRRFCDEIIYDVVWYDKVSVYPIAKEKYCFFDYDSQIGNWEVPNVEEWIKIGEVE